MADSRLELERLQEQIVACTRCARLIRYCRKVAREKRRMFREQDYWGKPVESFGDPRAELLIIGLAPAAHGGNRTGRMFTGDRSGVFLYRALFQAGWSNLPESRDRNDGLTLRGCYITALIRCAPPDNKPLPREIRHCRPYLQKELHGLGGVRAVLALGRMAFEGYLSALRWQKDFPPRSSFRFAHAASYALPGGLPRLFASYHPSQRNTQTGRLTVEMFQKVLEDISQYLSRD
jgi:uracil-DNA glycosylase